MYGRSLKISVLAADHSEPAYNASVEYGVPDFQHCFSHVIRKPGDTRKRHLYRGTKQQREVFMEVVKDDVRALHLCKTARQMEGLWYITQKHWNSGQQGSWPAQVARLLQRRLT